MLNETNSELEERSDSAAIEEMLERTEIQMPASIYQGLYDEAYELMYDDYMNHQQAVKQAIKDQQRIEDFEWNDRYGYYEH